MNKVNTVCTKDEEPPTRITRARARALGSLGGGPPYSRPSFKNEHNNLPKVNSKRAAPENTVCGVVPTVSQPKRSAVLKDVTNINVESRDKCIKTSKYQTRGVYKKRNATLNSDVCNEVSSSREDARVKLAEELSTIRMVESKETIAAAALDDQQPAEHCMSNSMRESVMADTTLSMQESAKTDEPMNSPSADVEMICEKTGASDGLAIVDIDSELKDSEVWTSYAPDIYSNIRITELEKRPLPTYMDQLQRDITASMRGILIDWLVEVCEEYKLVPDTLYLTVNLIDRFLSTSLIQKQRLQLLGVTCMLIASKYEEICAPRVEEFCFITDNTYTKEEVMRMESEVLNLLHFQLSVPTTKTFLRRFIQAAQSSYKVPRIELEFLANYLAELTLVEYSFLQFLPSLVAASAVFLARWTLNHSEHPWNPTLEHYTNFKASELKTVVLALEDLQLNTKGCPLNAIREKYKHQKFNGVASLSPKPVQSVFQLQV